MHYRKVYDTREKAEVVIYYQGPAGSTVVLEFPLVYARQATNLPGVLQALLTTTRPPLDPGEQSLARALRKAARDGASFRQLRQGDRVSLALSSGRGTISWVLASDGWNVIQ